MKGIIIDEEFRYLLPALDQKTFESLEEDIKTNGCRDAVVTWQGILVDGYNRYEICSRHGIEFAVVEMEFSSREEAMIWIIQNQVSRRNLTPIQLSFCRGMHYKAEKKVQGARKQQTKESINCQNDNLSNFTAGRIAQQYDVSPSTVLRDSKAADAINAVGEKSPEIKQMILSGAVKYDKNALETLATKTEEELAALVSEIESGARDRRSSAKKSDSHESLTGEDEGAGGFEADDGDAAGDTASHGGKPKQLLEQVSVLVDRFYAELRKMSATSDAAKAKALLKLLLEKLDVLYASFS